MVSSLISTFYWFINKTAQCMYFTDWHFTGVTVIDSRTPSINRHFSIYIKYDSPFFMKSGKHTVIVEIQFLESRKWKIIYIALGRLMRPPKQINLTGGKGSATPTLWNNFYELKSYLFLLNSTKLLLTGTLRWGKKKKKKKEKKSAKD